MGPDTILGLLDGNARTQAFQACLTKLESAQPLDLEALQVCIKLRPTASIVGESSSIEKLYDLLTLRIPDEELDPDHFYKLVSIVCSDGHFANSFFKGRLYPRLISLRQDISERAHRDAEKSDDAEEFLRQATRSVTAYLTLLKCSYWLPSQTNHVIDPDTLRFLSQFLGSPTIDSTVNDVLSAFLSLVARKEPITVAAADGPTQTWLKLDSKSGHAVLSESLVDGSLWDQISSIDLTSTTSGKYTISNLSTTSGTERTTPRRAH